MRFLSWNVNGIRASWNHGLSSLLHNIEADIYAFQETKVNEPFSSAEIDGYKAYWSVCQGRKGYSGTMVLSKYEPISVSYGFPDQYFDTEGRIITLEYDTFYFINCYVPNSQGADKRKDYRAEWDVQLYMHLLKLGKEKPVVVCGDFNVSLNDDDIYEGSNWQEINAQGFLSEERDNLIKILDGGFVDTYRLLHPDNRGKFTWWSNRLHKRKENKGWRLDYFFVSDDLAAKIQEAEILDTIYGSDHCPITLGIDLEVENKSVLVNTRQRAFTYQDLLDFREQRIPLSHIYISNYEALWNSIDWDTAEKNLATMQMALAKSAYSRSPDLIDKWQRKIVFSIDAKILAVRHVCDTAAGSGVDRIIWTTAKEKMQAALALTSKDYHAMPARLLLIRSKNGKQRRIHIGTYYDRAMQTLYSYALDPIAESWGDKKSFAYRKGRSAYDLHQYIISGFSGMDAPQWAVIADIKKCYENISHEWILKYIPVRKSVLREFLQAGYVFAGELFSTDVGIGIGCTISPIIANMVLDGMQDYIYSRLYPEGDIDYADGNLMRFADDIIVSARTPESARRIRQIIQEFLNERGLELSDEKSKIVHVSEGFTFMARQYVKKGYELVAIPSEKSVERFMASMKELIVGYKGSQKSLIEQINKKIDGWVTYHKITDAYDAFRKMDVYITALLVELCEQKHPKWTREKILKKYWYKDFDGRNCYSLPNKKEILVKFLTDALYYSYKPVKLNMNPYIDLEYMELKSHDRQIHSATGIYRSIWNRQEGKCYYCGRDILPDEEKTLVEVDAGHSSLVRRMAYVHKRCMFGSFEVVDTDDAPSSMDDIMDLLMKLDGEKTVIAQKNYLLSEYFRSSDKHSMTLTFKQIEDIMDCPLGASALRKEFWYRTGFGCISQCWIENGYEIFNLVLEGRRRVTFKLTADNKQTSGLEIPEALKYKRIPVDAKNELENYFEYIIKKYGL